MRRHGSEDPPWRAPVFINILIVNCSYPDSLNDAGYKENINRIDHQLTIKTLCGGGLIQIRPVYTPSKIDMTCLAFKVSYFLKII